MNGLQKCLLILSFAAVGLNCASSPLQTRKLSDDPSGPEISHLPDGVTVTFAAIVGRREGNCVEIFVPEEYTKYEGDGKWSISGRFIFDAPFIKEGTNVIITGKNTFVKDSADLKSTCNIGPGRLFDISAVR